MPSPTPVPKRWKSASAAVILSAVIGLLWAVGGFVKPKSIVVSRSSAVLDAISQAEVQRATAEENTRELIQDASAAIVPHHDIAISLIGQLAGTLRTATPETIVLIGPDHGNVGYTRYTISASDWVGATGTFRTNFRIIPKLASLQTVSISEEVIAREHSVLVPLPFLAARFPEARFVLVTIRGSFDLEADRAFADTLAGILRTTDLIIASVDFSHYKPFPAAEADDAISRAALLSDDPATLEHIPADSASSLAIAQMYAQKRGRGELTVVDHSNSALILGDPALPETTSYFTAVWH